MNRAIQIGIDAAGWRYVILQPGGPMVGLGNNIRLERGSPPATPSRMVIDVHDVVLEELRVALELPIMESPPLHEIEQRLSALSRRQDILDAELAVAKDCLRRLQPI